MYYITSILGNQEFTLTHIVGTSYKLTVGYNYKYISICDATSCLVEKIEQLKNK